MTILGEVGEGGDFERIAEKNWPFVAATEEAGAFVEEELSLSLAKTKNLQDNSAPT